MGFGGSSVQTPTDRYVRLGEINTRYWAVGEQGPAVVFLHGLGGCAEDWLANIRVVGAQHRAYALDLAGSGRTDKRITEYTLAYAAEFVRAFLDAMRIEEATLIGNSMGGAVALQCALQFPRRVTKLVLVGSAGLGRELNPVFRLASLPLLGRWAMRTSRSQVVRFMRVCVFDSVHVTDDFVDCHYVPLAAPGGRETLHAILRAGVGLRGVRRDVLRPLFEGLPGINAPALVIWGRQDRILPVTHARVAEERLPNARVHVFDRCGHMPQVEHPGRFNALVLDFLASAEAAPR